MSNKLTPTQHAILSHALAQTQGKVLWFPETLKGGAKAIREAKKNAPNVQMDPEALTSLKGRGDGYLRDRSSPRARRIQVRPLD